MGALSHTTPDATEATPDESVAAVGFEPTTLGL